MNIRDTSIRMNTITRLATSLRMAEQLNRQDRDSAQTDAAIMSILSGAKKSTNSRHYNETLRSQIT